MSASSNPAVRPDRIMEMVWGYAPPIILGTAIQCQSLRSARRRAQDRRGTGASLRQLRPRIARHHERAGGIQFLAKNSDGRYALTPESAAFLVSSKPGYLGKFAEFSGLKMIQTWLPLPEIVRTGKPSTSINQQDAGAAFFQELVEPIFAMSYPATQVAGQALGLANAKSPVKVLDIGTGSGVWGIGLAQQSPQVSVTAQDLPGVLDVTRQMVTRFNLADRFSYLPGDFHTMDFGTGYNLVTFGHISAHGIGRSEPPASEKGRGRAGSQGNRRHQRIPGEPGPLGSPMGLIFAVNMLAHTENGDTFSFEEISGWLKEAGLVNPKKNPLGPGGCVVGEDLDCNKLSFLAKTLKRNQYVRSH